jgi:McbB family protein
LVLAASQIYLSTDGKGAKISNPKLADILAQLQKQDFLEITEEQLLALALRFEVDIEPLKKVLINQLDVLKPMLARKIPTIFINADDELVVQLLSDSLGNEYKVTVVPESSLDFPADSLVIFYRKNYSNADFKRLYSKLSEDVYVITAGVLHKMLIIDNLYFLGSGLPTHVSNLHQLMAYLHSDIPATKNNWLLYYRNLVKNKVDEFPEPHINACQQGYIAYCLYQFTAQFTNLWKKPTTLDQINWFWHADLTTFNVHREVAIHSPFSAYDMKLNLANLKQPELV